MSVEGIEYEAIVQNGPKKVRIVLFNYKRAHFFSILAGKPDDASIVGTSTMHILTRSTYLYEFSLFI